MLEKKKNNLKKLAKTMKLKEQKVVEQYNKHRYDDINEINKKGRKILDSIGESEKG